MMARTLLLLATASFMFAARSFRPLEGGGIDGYGPGLTLALGFMLLSAFLMGKIASELGLPKLTGYLLAGALSGPNVLNLVTEDMVSGLALVNGAATALIALTAGGELSFKVMRPLARSIAAMTVVSVLGTTLLLVVAVHLLSPMLPFMGALQSHEAWAVAAVVGVILAAQSPAVVIAVRAELRADGPVTRTVLGVVVVADLVVIVLFALASAVCRAVLEGQADVEQAAGSVAWEIFGSMGVGVLIGGVLILVLDKVRASGSLFLVALCVAVAEIGARIHLDPLITALAAGIVVENSSDKGHLLVEQIESASLPLYVLFFAVAGASIHLGVLPVVGLPAALLAVTRGAGFLLGTRAAASWAGAPPPVRRWAGFGLIPQAGLAIALALILARTFPELGEGASALVLGVVTINELVAPVFFRRALLRSGEGRVEGFASTPVSDPVATG